MAPNSSPRKLAPWVLDAAPRKRHTSLPGLVVGVGGSRWGSFGEASPSERLDDLHQVMVEARQRSQVRDDCSDVGRPSRCAVHVD